MSISVAAQNVKEGLALPGEMPLLVGEIARLDADVTVLSDAYSLQNPKHGSRPEVLEEARASFTALGYALHEIEYDDEDAWYHDRNLMVLVRLEVMSVQGLRLATRNALDVLVRDSNTNNLQRIVAYHGDDRSKITRARSIRAFLQTVEPGMPTLLDGDFNDAHREDMVPHVLGLPGMRLAANAIPAVGRLKRPRSVATRVIGMASGTSLTPLEQHGFYDADAAHNPTFWRLQLDHVMVSPEVRVTAFRHGNKTTSDHVPTLVTIES